MRITVTENGPYIVAGDVPLVRVEILVNEAGESIAWREAEHLEPGPRYRLCRCGRSHTKPTCDGSHAASDFDGTEVAANQPFYEIAGCVEGPGLKLHDARELCAEARFCDRAGGLWNLVASCDDADVRALVEEEAALCPSGRYVVCDAETGEPHEPDFEPSIALVDDPAMGVSGPLWVRGGVPVIAEDGASYEVRNRVTLCRCGHSSNKPFCDGSHIKAGFTDA